TLPPEFTGYSTAAEIVVLPGAVYASNRGQDGVAWFRVHPDGTLKVGGWQSTLGKTPRFIGIEPTGHFLYAANEQSDTVVTLRVDQITGKPTPNGKIIQNASPVTIVFAGK
ncbi:MAG: beta-propeller fold lactonase family protein, partial [Mycobacterium sp.]|nr:beta-propeller fold lactonase family protein [Mycobacterium sp.]